MKILTPFLSGLLCILFFSNFTLENEIDEKKGGIKGTVIDTKSGQKMEYVSVSILDETNKIVSGGLTNEQGRFNIKNIKPGTYILNIAFIGYELKTVDNIKVDGSPVNLGNINMTPSSVQLDDVEIEAYTSEVEYQIDKKVINVDKQLTSAGGSAVDVLQNVPSVQTDADGNIELRGSSNFTVLIDGKPTLLSSADALLQIPAADIQNIELITNPSVKYNPDGSSGIINIITRKNRLQGFSGIIKANVGNNDNYGGNILLNYRKKSINWSLGVNHRTGNRPGTTNSDRSSTLNDTTYYTHSDGTGGWGRENSSVKLGMDWTINDKNSLNIGIQVNQLAFKRKRNEDYQQWNSEEPFKFEYLSNQVASFGGKGHKVNANFLHKFNDKGQKLDVEASYQYRNWNSFSNSELLSTDETITQGFQSSEIGPDASLQVKADYTLPLSKKAKIETGIQARINSSVDENTQEVYNPVSGNYDILQQNSYSTDFKNNIYSVYALHANQFKKLGIQIGLRGEVTDRIITPKSTDSSYKVQRFDFFPSIHASYKLKNDWEAKASYSRRVRRPRSYFLEPALQYVDAYNVRRGNPALLPQFTDSYEAGVLKVFGKNSFSAEIFYRKTNNKFEWVRTVYERDIYLSTVENVGQDFSLGTEISLQLKPLKWLNLNASGSVFNYKVKGTLYDEEFSNQSTNWNARLNTTFKLGKKTSLQWSNSYRSASTTAQGTREGFYTMDLGISRHFMDRKLSATFRIRDVFNSGRYAFTSAGPNFTNSSINRKLNTGLRLEVSYNFNKFKAKRSRSRLDNGGEGEGF